MANSEYGLLIERRKYQEANRVYVRIVQREEGKDYPRGISSFPWQAPKHLQNMHLDGLGLYGFVSDLTGNEFIGYEPEYRDIYSVGLTEAIRMTRTLKKLRARIQKDEARDPGDVFASFAKALGLKFYCKQRTDHPGSNYSDQDWNFGTIAEGRNVYRDVITKARDEVRLAAA